jgi:glucose-6-phosphate isomerase
MKHLKFSFKNDRITFGKNIASLPVTHRKIKKIKDFLKDKNSVFKRNSAYLMYRDVRFKDDEKLFRKSHLRYDITVIFPGLFGKEFAKTIGHCHKRKLKRDYPEIYEVLSGEALFLFQNVPDKKGDIRKAYVIGAKRGQKVIVPPGFGHITINPGSKVLLLANIFADNVRSDYSFYKKHRGGIYYILNSKSQTTNSKQSKTKKSKIIFEKNLDYKKVGKLEICAPREVPKFKISFEKPLYNSFVENPKNFEFLTKPEKYKNILKPNKLFKLLN